MTDSYEKRPFSDAEIKRMVANVETTIEELEHVDMTVQHMNDEARYITEINGDEVTYWEQRDRAGEDTSYGMRIIGDDQTFLFFDYDESKKFTLRTKKRSTDALTTANTFFKRDSLDKVIEIDNAAVDRYISENGERKEYFVPDAPDGISTSALYQDAEPLAWEAYVSEGTVYTRDGFGAPDAIKSEDILDEATEIYNEYRHRITEKLREEVRVEEDRAKKGLEKVKQPNSFLKRLLS